VPARATKTAAFARGLTCGQGYNLMKFHGVRLAMIIAALALLSCHNNKK
jgi:hypothetical protein